MATRVNEADYRFTHLRDRLIAAASGIPTDHQTYGLAGQREYRADRREYLRNWEITITNNTRAHLVYLKSDGTVGGLIAPVVLAVGTGALPPKNELGVVVSLHGHDIAVMTRTSLTLSMKHGFRSVTTAHRMRSILSYNTIGVYLGTTGSDRHGRDYATHLWTTWVYDPSLAEPGYTALVTNPQHPLIGPEGYQAQSIHQDILDRPAHAAPYQWLMTHPDAIHPKTSAANPTPITRLDVMSPANPTVTILGELR